MSSNSQNEFGAPTQGESNRTSARFLPRFFRSEANLKFLQATVDQLTQPGVAEKLGGFFGRKIAKGYRPGDVYVGDVNSQRENYQLEPALVIKNELGNVTYYKDYNDYINSLSFFNVNTANHDKLNRQESYPWNPNIDWDKFVNFREYYWLPDGPLSVPVRGQAREIQSTFTVSVEEADGDFSYVFNNKFTRNPSLKLYRGQTYRFEINCPGHPFAVAVTRSFTPGNAVVVAGNEGIRQDGLFGADLYGNNYDIGDWLVLPDSGSVTFDDDENVSTLYPDGIRKLGEGGEEIANVYIEQGVLEFTVPVNSPDRLFYISKNDIDVSGLFKIYDIEENSFIDVEEEVIGKKYYTSSNGVEFTNGLKVFFRGVTEPVTYQEGEYYVEGVGHAIKLIPADDLVITQTYSNDVLQPFDEQAFDEMPFGAANSYPVKKDYLTISRASNDLNAWSRSNRWFHRDVIEQSYVYNEIPIDVEETGKAKRPIIEFEPGLKLYNYGTFTKQSVDVIDTFTTDVFSTVEGTTGYNVDGVELIAGMRVLFAADTDIIVNGAIYEVKFVKVGNEERITFVETADSFPLENENVLVKQGNQFAGKLFFYNGERWIQAQDKLDVNQAPLFDLCCPAGNYYSDLEVFDSSTFTGCKVFSYKEGTGTNDTELGFPLTYRNINNTGDILFEFNLLTDSFTVQNEDEIVTVTTDTSFLRSYSTRTDFEYRNGWSTTPVVSRQKVLRHYDATESQTNNFEIDVYNNAGDLNDLKIAVFVNEVFKQQGLHYEIDRLNGRAYVRFLDNLAPNDVVLIKSTSSTAKNANGHYEVPYNLERNPLNQNISDFTLGEVIDHVDSMIEDIPEFSGSYPGRSNLRDVGKLDGYGKRFLKHAGPLNLPMYSITTKEYNIVRAIEYGKNEYTKFKRNFLITAADLGVDAEIPVHVDAVLEELNKDKVNTQPFYFSDMLGYKSSNTIYYNVVDNENPYYGLPDEFSLNNLNNKSILIYLNGNQLIFNKDYQFTDEQFAYIQAGQQIGDEIEIVEYESTDGSYIPPTPTKLGLYPRFEPELVIDEQWLDNQQDVNVTRPYAVYGENLNNHLDRGWFYPLYLDRKTAKTDDPDESVIQIMFKGSSRIFYAPASKINLGTSVPPEQYTEFPIGATFVKGHDGSLFKCYKDYRDLLLLELETRIYNNIKVDYDKTQINIHSYVGGRFRDTGLSNADIDRILIKDFADWNRVANIDYTANTVFQNQDQFSYNYSTAGSIVDNNSLPGYWRAVYKDAFDTDRPHTHPWEMLGFSIKPVWWDEVYGVPPYTSNNTILWNDLQEGIVREPGKGVVIKSDYARPGLVNFLPVDNQGQLKAPINANYAKNIVLRNTDDSFEFGDQAPVESAWRRSSEYPFSLIKAIMLNRPADFIGKAFDVARISRNLAGQYIYSETGKHLELDKLVFPNTYQDNRRIPASGLVNYIYNLVGSNVLTVYEDYKNNIKNIRNQLGIKLAGYTDKQKLNLLLQSKSPSEENAQGIFIPEENYDVFLNVSSPVDNVNYSGVLIEVRPDGYIIQGYNADTPMFRYYTPVGKQGDITVVAGGESANVVQWQPNKLYVNGQIVENNFSYFRVTQDFTSGPAFSDDNLAKLPELPITGGQRAQIKTGFNKSRVLELNYGAKLKTVQEVVDFLLGYGEYLKDQGFRFEYFDQNYQRVEDWKSAAKEFLFWSSQGWAAGTVIGLSPSAYEIQFRRDFAVVDDIFDNFYRYSLLAENGNPLERRFSNVLREKNSFNLSVSQTDNGIYNLTLPTVQKEHVILLDNETIFNDILYQPYSGYRQERIKVLGYRSDNWDGSLNIPGFVFDDATVTEWEPWQDYSIGSLVKYKEFYYVSLYQVYGSAEFNPNFWSRLSEKPESQLMTNFDFRVNQFADFYDVESIGFDEDQQRLAQHLIGYQKRDYLANIINDEVSQFKFYQGFIQDKGTRNSIDKLFNSLEGQTESLDFYEEWAVQSGFYGDFDKIKQVAIPLQEDKMLETPQGIELVDYIPQGVFDTTYRVRPFQLENKPADFTVNCFPTTKLQEYVLTGGYVHEDDVDYKIQTISELETVDNNLISIGEYLWVTDEEPNNWNVYRVLESLITINSFAINEDLNELGQTIATVEFSGAEVDIIAGDVIAINDAQLYNILGFFIVDEIDSSTCTLVIPEENNFKDFVDESFACVVLKSARVSNFTEFNTVAETFDLDSQKIWIDSYEGPDLWAVLQNEPVYENTYELLNPADVAESTEIFDETQLYAKDFATSLDNKLLFTSAPGLDNGVVYLYRRDQDVDEPILSQTINNPNLNFDGTESKFGESVAVTEDGEYVAIGIPDASSIKTKYQGIYRVSQDYNKGDIVKHKGSLWQAVRQVFGQQSNRQYSTFDSYIDIDARTFEDSSVIKLLLTGSPGLQNRQVNHFLVRAPADMYLGSKIGDQLKLEWNEFTYLNGDINTPYYPWNNSIPELGYNSSTDNIFIEDFHEIKGKIDKVLILPEYKRAVQVGDQVQTETGFADVAYVDISAGTMVLYINNLRGSFSSADTLQFFDFNTAITEEVGEYTEVDYGFTDDFNGFWIVQLDSSDSGFAFNENNSNYDNGTTFYEVGTGLVIADVIQSEEFDSAGRERNLYFNVIDSIKSIGAVPSNNLKSSMIHNLGDKYMVRMSPEMTAELEYRFAKRKQNLNATFGDTPAVKDSLNGSFINLVLGEYDEIYEDSDDYLPISSRPQIRFNLFDYVGSPFYNEADDAGLFFQAVNGRKTVTDLWDGYIDVTLKEVDPETGNLYRFKANDTISDVQRPFDIFQRPSAVPFNTIPENIAVVTSVKDNIDGRFDRQRLYIKIKSGAWELENNIAQIELERRREFDADRIIGEIENYANDVIVPSRFIGKFMVIDSADLGTGSNYVLENAEYFITTESLNELGADSVPSVPSSLNRDYEQVYNITTNNGGTPGKANEGCVAIFQRSGPDNYNLSRIIVSEQNFGVLNNRFGKNVKFVKNGLQYRLSVASDGDFNTTNPGLIEFFEHGPLNDATYKGTWNPNLSYNVNDTVKYDGDYYVAKINILIQNDGTILDRNIWENVSWRRSVDPNFKGVWEVEEEYARDSIVIYNGEQYVSQTNLGAGNLADAGIRNPVAANTSWTKLENSVEYAGFIPRIIDPVLTEILDDETVFNTANIREFTEDYVLSQKGEVLVTKVRQAAQVDTVQFVVYRQDLNGRYVKSQTIVFEDKTKGYGTSFDISADGATFAVSEPLNAEQGTDIGKVYVYAVSGEQFDTENVSVLFPPSGQTAKYFGYSLAFNTGSLNIAAIDETNSIGEVLVYESIQNTLVYSEKLTYPVNDTDRDQKVFGSANHVYVGMPGKPNNQFAGSLIEYRKDLNAKGWERTRRLISPVDVDKIRGVFLYNKESEQKITYLDYIDPVQGKIAGPAEQNLSYKVPYDPAQYNVGNTANDVNWADEHVGKLWWNTGNARFTYPYQGDINYQRSNWNELQPGATIDVYEWVESYLLPSAWDSITNTAKGTELGVTGVTLYGNDKYSKKFEFDREAQTFREKYYYWVKNKRTVPNIEGRTISALDVARLIAQPREQGYRFISFLADNRIVLNNCKSLVSGDTTVLNIDYITSDIREQNGHSVYQIITDGLATSSPNETIELKWFDSLIGFDVNDKPVPDIALAEKQKYGVQANPRQGMFVNRIEALKQFVERTNSVLTNHLVTENYNLANLSLQDEIPVSSLGEYDVTVATKEELFLVGTKVQRAEINPIIVNGKIVRVEIINPGRGYKLPPTYEITGTGGSATLEFQINNLGQITSATVTNPGENYSANTRILVRPFSVLVESDKDALNKWAIYAYNSFSSSWDRVKVQYFDVTRYWEYQDWFDTGYSEITEIDHYIDAQYQLSSLNDKVGDIIKIQNVGSGGWLALRKVNDRTDDNFALNYSVVGREKGTIRLLPSLYNAESSTTGFDNRSFDNNFYDVDPRIELRVILETLRDEIFASELRREYNQLFIASLRYILNEQKNPDWFFKTSFIKIKHLAGTLEQDITYNADLLKSYTQYVEEAKPFKTVIREFVSKYAKTEESPTTVTDFDLAPYYNTQQEKIIPAKVKLTSGQPVYNDSVIDQYPRRHWLDNFGNAVTEITVLDGGSEYRFKPEVEIVGGYGEGARAEAFIGYGQVTKVIVTHGGSGYTRSPQVRIAPPSNSAGKTATAVATLGDSVVRSVSSLIKFDRNTITNLYETDTLQSTETFTGTGADVEFKLKWPMDLDRKTVLITIDGEEIFGSRYSYENIKDTSKSYTRQIGKVTLVNPPKTGANIVIQYSKNISLLNAVDRIKFAYAPQEGMFGKDISQLMEGVDFGGVEVKSFDFVTSTGWDTEGWFNDIWDNAEQPQDEIVTLDGSTSIIILGEPLEDNVDYNIYRVSYTLNAEGIEEIYSNVRLDDPAYGTAQQKNLNAVCRTLRGDGSTQVVDLDDLGIRVDPQPEEDRVTIVVRKSTSDGAVTPDRNIYDADIDGGRLDYGNAKGVNAEEIVIDGDGFVTEFNAGGVEELVPGQVMDTLDMQVTTKGEDSTTVVRYRLFKDILNRTAYKRIDSPTTTLVEDLGQDDLSIVVDDATDLPEPNRNKALPGVIWIGKERIEYFVKEDNLLRQIRRGTLGTGVANIHPVGTEVYDQSAIKNIPYADSEQSQVAVNVNEIPLNFEASNNNEFEVFVNGTRLNGVAISKFDSALDQDSPEGDVIIPADYTLEYVSGTTGQVKVVFTNPEIIALTNKNIVIVRKQGTLWKNIGESLADTQTNIGFFLRSGN